MGSAALGLDWSRIDITAVTDVSALDKSERRSRQRLGGAGDGVLGWVGFAGVHTKASWGLGLGGRGEVGWVDWSATWWDIKELDWHQASLSGHTAVSVLPGDERVQQVAPQREPASSSREPPDVNFDVFDAAFLKLDSNLRGSASHATAKANKIEQHGDHVAKVRKEIDLDEFPLFAESGAESEISDGGEMVDDGNGEHRFSDRAGEQVRGGREPGDEQVQRAARTVATDKELIEIALRAKPPAFVRALIVLLVDDTSCSVSPPRDLTSEGASLVIPAIPAAEESFPTATWVCCVPSEEVCHLCPL